MKLSNSEKALLLQLLYDERFSVVQHWNKQGYPNVGSNEAKKINKLIDKLELKKRVPEDLEEQ